MYCEKWPSGWTLAVALAAVVPLTGCQQYWIDSADRIATGIIRERQEEALGATSDARLAPETGLHRTDESMYAFVPGPITPDVPEDFERSKPEDIEPGDVEVAEGGTLGVSTTGMRQLLLSDALEFAFRNAWDFQTQKEDLYLSALALMTERQLWTPQLMAEIRAEYANFGQVRNFDQAMTAVSDVSVSQRLPYGGEVAARVVNTLMRDIGRHTTTGESGRAILEANIPLLRGAGRVAFESRYQAERDLIYAVRTFERNRRELVVDVSGQFFTILATREGIDNALAAYDSAKYGYQRSQAGVDVGNELQVDADRFRVQMLNSEISVIAARVAYQAELDRFKVRIGMATGANVDAVDEGIDLLEPDVSQESAVETALRYRLDLLNLADEVDDSKRGVMIARNNFLPQLDLSGQVTMATDPNRLNSVSYNTERTTWQAFASLEIPLDRRDERNFYRASLIGLRRAERNYHLGQDNVRLDVRDALRALELARQTIRIEEENIRVNSKREEIASHLLLRGMGRGTIDVTDAQRDLQSSRNRYALAVARYRRSILTLLLQCGTLRVDDDGRWVR